ncbi:major tail protein [Mycobacterium phage Phlei]|uniref:Major tail protein n=1 Tax=Mycobacterium phage Phlei TaxID=1690684 RepID=A0A0N7E4H2_9CAUD|nr:major tail protein [Mycobacterium phage Phlei]ALA48131.1 hypothetical protein [Mycobacterium phage Phlei]
MAENDDALISASLGYVYVAAPGTLAPTPAQLKTINLTNPNTWTRTGWSSVGHTSRGTLPEFGYEGGEPEVVGSWQKKKLREITPEDPIDFTTVVLHQFDEQALGLYYGPNASSDAGMFGVDVTQKNEVSLFIVIVDGDVRLGHWAPLTSAKRDEAIELPIDGLGALPVRFTYLDYQDYKPFYWINEDLFNASPAGPKTLSLGGATGGTFTLKVDGNETEAINHNASASAIKSALAAVDDGIKASQITVTASGPDFLIDIPAVLTVGVDSTTGGTGVTLS